MKILSNCIGLMAVFCVIDGANAALRTTAGSTSRVSSIPVNSAAAAMRRLPTVRSVSGTTTSATTTSTSSLMDKTECVDAYTECIKDPDVCGFDFEECTTHELFYAKKPQCNNVLLQCSTDGINTLFGTTLITNLTADNMEVYPTQGSILGQFIEAGAINNRLDKSSCVKRYTSCLHKENVCGEDFELCTSDNEFKKQKIYCESTLARCTDDGKTELFGSTNVDSNPTTASRLGEMITEGAQLAAKNAVSTCYKVANQCFLNACGQNPYRCIINSSMNLVNATDKLNDVDTSSSANQNNDVINAASVSRYLRGACEDAIGGNKYCHMTYNKGKVPTPKDLIDEGLRDEVYSDIYASVMNSPLRDQIQKNANSIDAKAKSQCSDTITACAMRSCGGGLGSACYASVFGSGNCFDLSNVANPTGSNQAGPRPNPENNSNSTGATTLTPDIKCSVNGDSTYLEIRNGCEAIVNTDQNCLYAVASLNNDMYNYTYNNAGAFTTLFPTMETLNDPIGVVTRLNAALRDNYNPAAIERMGKQCEAIATGCIKSMCGAEFKSCYRNRTDIMTDTYTVADGGTNTIDTRFANSMQKVGGVLDFTIVRGLCLETVKNADVCDEHLKIQSIVNNDDKGAAGWGKNTSVRDAWVGAVSSGYNAKQVETDKVLVGCKVSLASAKASEACANAREYGTVLDCDTVDDNGCLYDEEVNESRAVYKVNMAADTLFQKVMGDIERKVQADYNAKLTREHNMCRDANNGGIMARNDHSGTYLWAKLRRRSVPKNYATSGLKNSDFEETNDLYGAFCRARVTIQSDDPDIQNFLQKGQNWSTTYFAVGDVFTCGSWIPQKELEKIANRVACKKAKAEGMIDRNVDCNNATDDTIDKLKLTVGQQWAQWGAAIASAGVMGVGMDLLQTKTGLGGLLTTRDRTTSEERQLEDAAKQIDFLYDTYCVDIENKSTGNKCTGNNKCFAYSQTKIGSTLVKSFKYRKDGDNWSSNCVDLQAEQKRIYGLLGASEEGKADNNKADNKWWDEYGKRATADAVAGLGGGLVAGIGVHNALKAKNRQKFTENEQAFMREIGDHIYCFIGADEAGTYGDLIEISID